MLMSWLKGQMAANDSTKSYLKNMTRYSTANGCGIKYVYCLLQNEYVLEPVDQVPLT